VLRCTEIIQRFCMLLEFFWEFFGFPLDFGRPVAYLTGEMRNDNQIDYTMAYFTQENKKQLAPAIKALCKEYGIKATLAVDNYSTFVVNIKSGKLDFFSDLAEPHNYADDYINVNPYWIEDHFTGKSKEFLTKLLALMKGAGWYNNSDAMTDYFHRSHYIEINIGKSDKPYECLKGAEEFAPIEVAGKEAA